MAVGNTFGATALSSYGGFWLAFAIVLTPGGFNIVSALESADGGRPTMFHNSFGLFLFVSHNQMSMRCVANNVLGLVHFHHDSSHLHSQVDSRILPSIFHFGYDIPPVGLRLH